MRESIRHLANECKAVYTMSHGEVVTGTSTGASARVRREYPNVRGTVRTVEADDRGLGAGPAKPG